MKSRVATAVAVLTLAVTASAAYASALEPATGQWKGSPGFVNFAVKKSGTTYTAAVTKSGLVAGCDAPNGADATTAREFTFRGFNVKLARSGQRLKGTKTVTRSRDGGKATETRRLAITILGARRASVVVSGDYDTKLNNPKSNADDCSRREKLTAKPAK